MSTAEVKDNRELLGSQPIPALLARYSAPAIAGMVADALYHLVDAIFIGQGIGALALSALAIIFPIHLFLIGSSHMIGVGAASIISRALGAGNETRARQAVGNALFLAVAVSVLMPLGLIPIIDHLLPLMGSMGAVTPFAKSYLLAYLPFIFPLVLSGGATHAVRAEGNAKISMIGALAGTGMNIVLDAVFILVFKWGMAGAALATVISAGFSLAVFLWYYFFSDNAIARPGLEDIRPRVRMCFEIVSIGFATFARMGMAAVVNVLVNIAIRTYGGPYHLSVLSMIYRMMVFASLPVYGIGLGMQPIVGYNYGAQNYSRVSETVKLSLYATTIIALVFWVLLMVFTGESLQMFTNSEELQRMGVPLTRILLILFPLIGFRTVGSALFMALGKPFPAFIMNVATQLVFLPLILILPSFFGLLGIWLVFPIADAISFLFIFIVVMVSARRMRKQAYATP